MVIIIACASEKFSLHQTKPKKRLPIFIRTTCRVRYIYTNNENKSQRFYCIYLFKKIVRCRVCLMADFVACEKFNVNICCIFGFLVSSSSQCHPAPPPISLPISPPISPILTHPHPSSSIPKGISTSQTYCFLLSKVLPSSDYNLWFVVVFLKLSIPHPVYVPLGRTRISRGMQDGRRGDGETGTEYEKKIKVMYLIYHQLKNR